MSEASKTGAWSELKPVTHETQEIADKVSYVYANTSTKYNATQHSTFGKYLSAQFSVSYYGR